MSEFGSYIDDSFGARPWPELPQPATNPKIALYDFNRPREGHWDVVSSAGSFVDDRCPTVYGYPATSPGKGNVTKIDGGLAQQLARATAAEKLATLKAAAEKESTGAYSVRSNIRAGPLETPEQKRRPFNVPANLARKPNVTNERSAGFKADMWEQAGAGIAAEAALLLPKARTGTGSHANENPGVPDLCSSNYSTGPHKICILGKNGERAFVELPAESSNPSQRRISSVHDTKEKSGPPLVSEQRSSRPDKKATDNTKDESPHEAPLEGKKAAKQQNKQQNKQKTKQQNTKQNKLLEKQQNRQNPEPEADVGHVEGAEGFLMSGGLPPASVAPSRGSIRSKASMADSVISQKVLSIAQKIASMPPGSIAPSHTPSMRQPTPAISILGWTQVGQGRTGPAPVSDHETKTSMPSTNYRLPSVHSAQSSSTVVHGFGGSAFNMCNQPDAVSKVDRHSLTSQQQNPPDRTTNLTTPLPAAGSEGPNRTAQITQATPSASKPPSHVSEPKPSTAQAKSSSSVQHSFRAASGFRSAEPTPPAGVNGNIPASKTPIRVPSRPPSHRSGQEPLGGQQQTKFAGTGWISPHPLSVAPTEMASPPQSVVHLPGESFDDPGATLTYDEWKAQRDDAATVTTSQPMYMVPSLRSGPRTTTSPHVSIMPNHHNQNAYALSQHAQHSQHSAPRNFQQDQDWVSNRSVSAHASHRSISHRSARQDRSSHHSHHDSTRDERYSHTSAYPSVLAQDAGWGFPPQIDGSGSDVARTSYNVGLTPNELDEYNRRLGDTISHHSAQLSRVQQEQEAPQPDYSTWDRLNIRSSRPSSRHTSTAARSSTGKQEIHLPMPWDAPGSGSTSVSSPSLHSMVRTAHHSDGHGSARSDQGLPSHSTQNSQRGPSAREIDSVPSKQASAVSTVRVGSSVSNNSCESSRRVQSIRGHLGPIATSSLRSNGPSPPAPPVQSEATYGTRNWQNLEDAEQGRGGFQSYRMW